MISRVPPPNVNRQRIAPANLGLVSYATKIRDPRLMRQTAQSTQQTIPSQTNAVQSQQKLIPKSINGPSSGK